MPDDFKGLSEAEANTLHDKFGPNQLPEKSPPTDFEIFFSQIKNPLVYVLLAATIITTLLGDYEDTIIISLAVGINIILGFIQERKASHALSALKSLVHPLAKVIRGGKTQEIQSADLVPGDIVILDQGAKIPADGIMLEANRFFADEAILTGESRPVTKNKKDLVFMGTVVAGGRGLMLIEKIGAQTEIGKIALDVQVPEEDTPLKLQLKKFSKQLTYLVMGLTAFVFIVGLLTGQNIEEIFTTSVALAVSSIPEGLLVALTVILAVGMQKIVKRKGLVRKLLSAETLGGVTTLCVDKTGTLTEGNMKVVQFLGDKIALSKQAIIANDLDDPITLAAWQWAKKTHKNPQSFQASHERLDSIPFTSKDRFFASLNKYKGQNTLYVNGAPEFLLEWSNISSSEKKLIKEQIEEFTTKGMRIVGFAVKSVSASHNKIRKNDVLSGLTWVGVLVFSDPVRLGVRDAIKKVQKAGIKLIVITGDYPATASAVMSELGLKVNQKSIILGEHLSRLTPEELAKKLKKGTVSLFARTTPNQKLKIVEALKNNGEIIAMMGDGVNDAPALYKSDIGIVVGSASDVAKETADLVLLDSNFETVVAAIEEGRGIFDNIRKVLLYLVSDSFEEIVAVVGSIILGLPVPITAAQILWINIISDGFPNLALTIDPKAHGTMDRPPRPPAEPLVTIWMRELIAIVSLSGGIIALIIFIYYLNQTGSIEIARSVAFAAFGVNSLIYVFSIKTLKEPFWKENPFNNHWLIIAVIMGMFFQFLPFMFQGSRKFFDLTPLSIPQLVTVFSASFVMFIIIESIKHIKTN